VPQDQSETILNGAALYAQDVTERDALGRTTHLTETLSGAAHTVSYEYDLAGRSKSEIRVGTRTAYTYDPNNNRFYLYANGDPVNFVDPGGLADIEINAINRTHVVGKIAWLTRLLESGKTILMSSVSSMVSGIVGVLGEDDKIKRLNVMDHGNSNGADVGEDYLIVESLLRLEPM
jgi:YD repeat-containing protein